MLGRPGTWAPDRKKVTPGAWFTASVCMLRTRHRSSARLPSRGSIVLISIPHWPYFWNGLIGETTGHLAEPLDIVESRVWPRTLAGMSWPPRSINTGFGSKRSTCDGPPPCQSITTRLALGSWCGRPGSPGRPCGTGAACVSRCSSDASATEPMPSPAEPNRRRRVTRWVFSRRISSTGYLRDMDRGRGTSVVQVGADPAPSPDVRCGHPALRSLHAGCASASCLRLPPRPAPGAGSAPPSLMIVRGIIPSSVPRRG